MNYIKVTNFVNEVNRIKLEKLGFSTKRENEETIGQFGSGIKFAPIAAIRKGMRFVFTGNDSKGNYSLEYIIKEDDGIPCVFYSYGDYEKPSSFTADAGVLSWESYFQIYREVIANAIDESKLSGIPWQIDVVSEDEIKSNEGEFSVFISATDEIMEVHNNFDKYFSINRTPIYEAHRVKLYEPIDEHMRVYSKGVLVYCSDKDNHDGRPEITSMFDYEIDDIKLNEERTIADTFEMHGIISRTLASIDDIEVNNKVFNSIFNDTNGTLYEFNNIAKYQYEYLSVLSKTWSESFDLVKPNSIIVEDKKLTVNLITHARSVGYEPYPISNEVLYTFLTKVNVKTIDDIAGEQFQYEIDRNIEGTRLQSAFNICLSIFPNMKEIADRIAMYDGEDKTILGLTIKDKHGDAEMILIERDHCELATMPELIATIIHEWDHYWTGCDDGNYSGRLFRSYADEKIGYLVYKLWNLERKNKVV